MDVFRTDRIRNVVLLGHSGSGKTSLTEAMAYLSGMTNRLGKVTDGNTVSDFDKEEIKRKCSISTTLVPVVWGKNKINVLDTPGMFDFVGEAQEAASGIRKGRRAGRNPESMGTLREIQSSAYDLRNGNGSGRCQLPRSR